MNDDDLRHATHEEAVVSLTQPTTEIRLVVQRDPQPEGLQVSCTQLVVGRDLFFSLKDFGLVTRSL